MTTPAAASPTPPSTPGHDNLPRRAFDPDEPGEKSRCYRLFRGFLPGPTRFLRLAGTSLRGPLVAGLTLVVAWSTAQADSRVATIARRFRSAVATIVALDAHDQPLALGSGFFLDNHGSLVTNHHVLAGCAKAIVKLPDGRQGSVTIVTRDDPDLDLLVAKTTLESTTPLPLGDSDTVLVGEDVVAIGNPAGLEGTVSQGIVSGVRKAGQARLLQITAPISPGSSGGPVFNMAGRVIGIATSYIPSGQNLNFAIPANYLTKLPTCQQSLPALARKSPLDGLENKAPSLIQVTHIRTRRTPSARFGDAYDTRVSFSIDNSSNYPIKNITLLFIYHDIGDGAIISYSWGRFPGPVAPHLALRLTHSAYVPDFCQGLLGQTCGEVEVRILDYEVVR